VSVTRLLVLGGGRFVGWALAEEAVARGWSVTCASTGRSPTPAGAEHVAVDRTTASGVEAIARLAPDHDAIVDTWSGDPHAVELTLEALPARRHGYCYISSRSVYRSWGPDESAPTIDVGPSADPHDYAVRKRRAEIAVAGAVPRDHLLLRPGVVLGPRENLGRSVWWHDVMLDPVPVVPGPPDLPVQAVDVRDLASFTLDRLGAGDTGPYDVAAPPVRLRDVALAFKTAVAAPHEVRWTDEACVARLGLTPWASYPLWLPRSHTTAWFYSAACDRARAAGLRTRDLLATVTDWYDTWMAAGWPAAGAAQLPDRAGRDRVATAAELTHRSWRSGT
jgi:nucleoside-diphosphate-sugar epimerase